jgi:hypothetical protein
MTECNSDGAFVPIVRDDAELLVSGCENVAIIWPPTPANYVLTVVNPAD